MKVYDAPAERGRSLEQLVEHVRAWHVARQRFDAASHSTDVTVLKPLWRGVLAAEERLAAAIEELDR